MQDIVPAKKVEKKSKTLFIVLGVTILILVSVTVTYFFLKKEEPKNEDLANELSLNDKEPEGEFIYVIAKDGLNMRSGPSENHSIIYKLPFMAKLEVRGKSKDQKWYEVDFNKISGWVSADYISEEKPDDLTLDWLEEKYQGNISLSLKYPKDWRQLKSDNKNVIFYIKSPRENYDKIYIEILEGKVSDYAPRLIDENHSLASKSIFYLDNLSGNKYVIQTLNSGNIIYAEDIILLQKDNFIIKIAGPANSEAGGEIFDLFVWTISFIDKEQNEKI